MSDKLMEADSLAAKRLLLKKFLKISQFTIVLLSLVCVGFMSAASAYNVLASNLFFKSAAEYRAGNGELASRVREDANTINDTADKYQGVSLRSFWRASPHALTLPPPRYRKLSRPL
jgi:hypothetical protein